MRASTSFCVAACWLTFMLPVSAQNYQATPHYEQPHRLGSGFWPDPHVMEVSAGGDSDMRSNLGEACSGFASRSPAAHFSYQAGDRYPLTIKAEADAPASLIVLAPNGTWYCDDQSDGVVSIRLAPPPSGDYDVWVGLMTPNSSASARISITELE